MALSTADQDEDLCPAIQAEPKRVGMGDAVLGAVAWALVFGTLAAVSLWGWCEALGRRVAAAWAVRRSSR